MKEKVCLLLFWILLATGVAQTVKKYPFIAYQKSKIIFPGDSSQWLKFYSKLDDLYDGKNDRVTIMHIGGSHVQAGIWTGTIIKNFQSRHVKLEGGGAFAFPFKLAKTNSPHFYKTFSNGKWKKSRSANLREFNVPVGMAGIAVITNDSANQFGIALQKNEHFNLFSEIRVFHNFNPSFSFEIDSGFPAAADREEHPDKGYTSFYFSSPLDSLSFKLIKKDTLRKDFILYGFFMDALKPGFVNVGLGVNGASSASILRCDLFTEQLNNLLCCKPDLVILSLGVNDVQGKGFDDEEYMAHYDSLIFKIKKVMPECAILFTTTTDNYVRRKYPNKRTLSAEEATYKLAVKHKAAVYDLFAVMGGLKSIYKWYKAGLAAKDKVHFNSRGYVLIGNMMYEAMDESYRFNSRLKNKLWP
jgi:lysophospholipase L1-like esterase